jgi:hypothetical protein
MASFRKNAMKTHIPKSIKLGLQTTSKNRLRTSVAAQTVSLKANVGGVIQDTRDYILGTSDFTEDMKAHVLGDFGQIGYDLTILSKLLKVKTPTATKKIKLTGTRTAGLLELDALTTDLLTVINTSTFTAPVMTLTKKMVTLPNKGGIKEEREVAVIDMAKESELEAHRQESIKTTLAKVIDLFWRLCFDIFHEAPALVFSHQFEAMQARYPNIEFEVGGTEDAEEATEAKAEAAEPKLVKGKTKK